jgi:8-oxo-dGTP pyrophosphatase MutT (NUDIX family)
MLARCTLTCRASLHSLGGVTLTFMMVLEALWHLFPYGGSMWRFRWQFVIGRLFVFLLLFWSLFLKLTLSFSDIQFWFWFFIFLFLAHLSNFKFIIGSIIIICYFFLKNWFLFFNLYIFCFGSFYEFNFSFQFALSI